MSDMPNLIYAGDGIYLEEDEDDSTNKGCLWEGKEKYHHDSILQAKDREIAGLYGTIESQKQTHDALIKKLRIAESRIATLEKQLERKVYDV